MKDLSLLNKLNEIYNKETVSFHVPGHKNGKLFEKIGYEKYRKEIVHMDTTEILETDNLHHPKEIIKMAQDRAAKVFKSDNTFFLVNGSTCGIYASIMAICDPKDKIIVSRDCHQSVINGCILGGIEPIYIQPKIDEKLGISLGVEVRDIENALQENPQVKGVLLTSPTYFGVGSPIEKIAKAVHGKGKILIVDEAHGSHLGLSDLLPKSAIEMGADLIIQSTHKTLPSFTQSSMLHVKGNRVNQDKLRSMLKMLQSSSPSYMLMSSLEMAVEIYEKKGIELMTLLIEKIKDLKAYIKNLKNIDVFEIEGKDITKIYIITKNTGKSGYEIEEILRYKHNIQVELSTPYGVLLISSIGNDSKDFERLKIALKEIDQEKGKEDMVNIIPCPNEIPKKILSPREAFYSLKKSISIEKSIGKVCGEYIIPYPPGIPILSPGEEITKEIIEYAKKGKTLGMSITGMKDSSLENIQIIEGLK